ncbi:MAG: NAD-dependent deacylase [Chitinophagaceae bacterium]|nr:NAD-dependent deacylase [Chitinophagaceae bacterium]
MRKKLVVLTGAGISAESGLKTFRDSDGLWEGYDVMQVASPGGWKRDPAQVLEFYNLRRKQVAEAKPNAAHRALAELEKEMDIVIITQNIDDLHERAGSTKVLHLHGEIFKMRSESDERLVKEIRRDIRIGDLAEDGGQYRPDIVWFEEPVPLIEFAADLAGMADIFAVVGTSLAVYPAAGLVNHISAGVPVYVVDKKIPPFRTAGKLILIEKPASEGVKEMAEMLLSGQ